MSQETQAPSEQRRTALIYSPALVQAALPARHPLKLDRPAQVRALIESYGCWPRPASARSRQRRRPSRRRVPFMQRTTWRQSGT